MGRLSSWSQLVRPSAWRLEPEPSTFAPSSAWSNKDMDPVPPDLRTWTTFNFVMYWISDAANVGMWALASSMLAIGLSWRQALPAIVLGNIILGMVLVLSGTIGARLHIPFPVINRSSFGFWLSYFSVTSRVVLSLFWFGIQSTIGSECVYQMLKAIWPSIAHLPNHLPQSSHLTSSGMICYFLYWSIQFPFMFIPPQKMRWLFLAKAVIVPPTWLALLIWAFVKVPPNSGLLAQKMEISGSELSWAWLGALNSVLGSYSAMGVNIPDFTRYAKNERAQYIQALIVPVAFTLCSFVGIFVTSAGITLYGQVLWNPLKLIDHWDNRAAVFFTAFAFALATLGTNISANSLSAGNDMTALWPRYINIQRGQVICAFLGGWALCPWEILASATGFLSFMSGYTVFISPITGIMITDASISIGSFTAHTLMFHQCIDLMEGIGIRMNWRAAAAVIVPVSLTLPGLISNINPDIHVAGVGARLFDVSYMLGFILASAIYFTLSTLFPANDTMLDHVILEDETLSDDRSYSNSDEKKGDIQVEEAMLT